VVALTGPVLYKCFAFFSTVVIDRGVPVARLLAVGSSPQIEQLAQQGVISGPRRSGLDEQFHEGAAVEVDDGHGG